jgi:hypothetical protein
MTMKKTIQTIIVAMFVVMITGTFAFAAAATSGGNSFPYFHLGCLIMGGLTIISLKYRYEKMYLSEAVGSFALYAVLVALFTAPVIEAVKGMISWEGWQGKGRQILKHYRQGKGGKEVNAMKRMRKDKLNNRNLNHIVLMSAWSFTLVISSFIFMFVGRWIDLRFNTEPAFMLGLFVLAISLCIGRIYMDFTKTREQIDSRFRHHQARWLPGSYQTRIL